MRVLIVFVLCFSSLATESLVGEMLLSKNQKALVKVKEDKENFFLLVKPQQSRNECQFKIRKISSPAKLKGRDGIIQADRSKCRFQISNKDQLKFWNSIVTIDLNYNFITSEKLLGKVRANSISKMMNGTVSFKLNKK